MKRTVLLLFSVFVFACGYTQSKYTDSLDVELSSARDDTSRVMLLTALGYYHRYQNLDTAEAYAKRALALAQKINFPKGESNALQVIGVVYRLRGDLSKSLELQFKALKIAETHQLKSEKAFSLMRIALVYYDLAEYAKTISITHASLQIHGAEKILRVNAIGWLNLGMSYSKLNNPDSAMYYVSKIYDHLYLMDDLTSDICREMGKIQISKANRPLALRYFKESIDAAEDLKDYRAVSLAYAELAKMYRDENRPDSSIYFARNGLAFAQKTDNKRGILACGNLLAELYETVNPAEALRYYKIASEAKEGLFGAGNLQAIQALVSQEEARQQEIASSKAAYQAQLKQYSLMAALGVFLLIAALLYRNNLNRKKANALLQQQKAEVEVQKKNVEYALTNLKSTQAQLVQSEKMASLGELTAGIAHEIQNPLNFVNNFSEVNSELITELEDAANTGNIDEVKAIAQDLKANEDKIRHHGKRADSIVKGMLQHSQKGSGEKALTDINALADEYFRLAYHGLRAKDNTMNANIETSLDESIGKVLLVQQDISRVLLNLYNNAFYAVAERFKKEGPSFKPLVTLTTARSGNNINITVSDNGSGIPEQIKHKIFQPFLPPNPRDKVQDWGCL